MNLLARSRREVAFGITDPWILKEHRSIRSMILASLSFDFRSSSPHRGEKPHAQIVKVIT